MSKLAVRKSRRGVVGVFAVGNYKPGQVITEITGNIVHWQTLGAIGGVVQDNAFRFSENYYLSPDGIGNYLNHSCQPNAGIYKKGDKLYLKAISKIVRDQEVVFDYSTITGKDDVWKMKCSCGSRFCRKVVKNFNTLPTEIKDEYLMLGAVPYYIIETLK